MKQSPLTLKSAALLSVLISAPFVAQSSPLVSIGDNVDVFFNGHTSLRWTSNVFRDEDDEVDDLLLSFVPGFEVNVGRGVSNADLSFITRYEIRRYNDQDRLDTELLNLRANGSYRGSRLDLSGSAFFREEKSSTGDTNTLSDLIESDTSGFSLNGEYRFSPKFSFGAGYRYDEREYKPPYDNLFADRETTTIPLDLFYELTPKVDLSVGYTYTERDIEQRLTTPAYSTDNHFLNVGARGNLLPKLTGFFKVGYRTREDSRNGVDDASTFGLDADLTWAATPKFTSRVGLSRDFGVSGEGQSTENTSIDVAGNYSLNNFVAATAFATYTLREYQNGTDREDNQYRFGARLSYRPNENWSFSGGYTYSENDSTQANSSYVDHSLDLTASLRY